MNEGVLLVQSDLKKIVSFSERCINAGVVEDYIYATVYSEDVKRFLNTKGIGTVIMDSSMYNMETASVLKSFAQENMLRLLLVTQNKTKKTLRMLMDENIRYINAEISAFDLANVLGIYEGSGFKKASNM